MVFYNHLFLFYITFIIVYNLKKNDLIYYMSIYLNNILLVKKKKGASKNLGSLLKKRKYLFINLKRNQKDY